MNNEMDLYAILQVHYLAEQEVIDVAYRRLARMYHPDVNRSEDATSRMQDIVKAYEVLGNPVTRAEYDRVRKGPKGKHSEPRSNQTEKNAPPREKRQRTSGTGAPPPRNPTGTQGKDLVSPFSSWKTITPIAIIGIVIIAIWVISSESPEPSRAPTFTSISRPTATPANFNSYTKSSRAPTSTPTPIPLCLSALMCNNTGRSQYNSDEIDAATAIKYIDEAIRFDPNYSDAYNNRGILYSNLNQYEKAIENYDEAIRLVPDFSAAYTNRGTAYYNSKQYEKALEDFNTAIRIDPWNKVAITNRDRTLDKMPAAATAKPTPTSAPIPTPMPTPTLASASGYYGVASTLIRTGDDHQSKNHHDLAILSFDEAIKLLELHHLASSLRLDPIYANVYHNRGVSYAGLGQDEKAIEDYTEAILVFEDIFDYSLRIDPNFAKAYYNRGVSYGKLGQYEKAIEDYTESIRLDPQYTNAYNNRGVSYSELGQTEKAIEDFTESIRIDPNNARVYNNRGFSYDELGEYEKALKDYDEAIRLDPTYTLAYWLRGMAYHHLGEYEKALKDYDEAIRLDTTHTLAYNDRYIHIRGMAYHELGEYEKALKDYDEVLRLDPTHANAYTDRGILYRQLGEYEKALKDFREAIRLDPTHTAAYHNRGITYDELGRSLEAERDIAKAKELGDYNPKDWFQ